MFISKKPCIGKPSDRFLDSWEKELGNTRSNLREVLIKEYVRKLFQLITQRKKLKELRKLCKDNSNLYFACLTRFESHDEFFDFKYYFLQFCNSFVPDFENLHYLAHLNDNTNGTLADSNSDEEIALDITGFHDKEFLDKQSLTDCDH